MVHFFLATWIFRRELPNHRSAWTALARRAREAGYAGLEIHDRKLGRLAGGEPEKVLSYCRSLGLEIILGLDTEFTRAHPGHQNREIQHARQRITWARDQGITRIRLTTGGQRVSLAQLIKKIQPYSPVLSQAVETFLNRPIIMKPVRQVKRRLNRPVPQARLDRLVQGLEKVLPAAAVGGVLLVLENHWGVSSDWRTLEMILKRLASPHLGVCLDWGNFPSFEDILPGVTGLLPWTRHMHAKSFEFDSRGEETTVPYRGIVRRLRAAGYSGSVTVEYEGNGDPWEGCRQTRGLIDRCYREDPV